METNRYCGILCHLTSLPSKFGVGDFGSVAYHFIDQLALAKQSYWQILPIGKSDDSGCPYATDSAFGAADYYVSPEMLIKEYKLDSNIFDKYFLETARVDFKQARINKQKILEFIYTKFTPNKEYKKFLEEEKYWINDYCNFKTLSESRGSFWRHWGAEEVTNEEKARIEFHKFCQFTLFSQLKKLKAYANSKNIKIIGDLPIFLSYNSMDVWKNPKQFYLKENLDMEFEAGAAPDAFSTTGQKWGTPLYDWSAQKENKYQWWSERLSFLKRYFDVVRIDHFRGFCATWISHIDAPDATAGHWYPGPGADLFYHLNDTPEIIAEDLGYITPDVDQLREQFNFPGMRVFQFLLGGSDNPHKLYNYKFNTVAYSGTHDCNTLVGWFDELTPETKKQVEQEIHKEHPTHWDMMKVVMNSPSKIVLVQIQDLLGFGTEARFNYPGTVQDLNWTWKMQFGDLETIDWPRFIVLVKESKRVPHPTQA